MHTSEGYQYFPNAGIASGLPTRACISPPNRNVSSSQVYDVIVIGAGYAGLVACRNLANQGHSVLLIEARDRIGGRTYSAELDGQQWDMGGTWMHWTMPHIYSEIQRYGLVDQLNMGKAIDQSNAYHTLKLQDGRLVTLSLEQECRVRQKALNTFFDVDGAQGHLVMPNPHRDTLNAEAFHKLSRVSVQERMEEVKSQLTDVEMAYVAATCINWCGMDLSKMSFFDCMRWWALGGYHPDGINHTSFSYKLDCGQTGLARAIFDDASSFANFSYSFKAPVSKISRAGSSGLVMVQTVNNECHKAKQLICTIPWNVLDTIAFDPPLPQSKQVCIDNANLGNAVKLYAEVAGQEWDAWTYLAPPGSPEKSLAFAASAGGTPSGNGRMVFFGFRDDVNRELCPEENPEETMAALHRMNPKLDIKRLVWHNWTEDPYAKGIWVMFRTGEAEKRLPALRESVGPVHFASADWAHGWRGYIDGAVEQGTCASVKVRKHLQADVPPIRGSL